ncbi:MAG TPA: methyltransferase domain-containing protein [Phycisphaerae bacterium]|nr:methyltransferase domain-containing protein [Phycisphaerae bacterium]
MADQAPQQAEFVERFLDRKAVERYRDRYRTGRHARVNQMERAALRDMLGSLGRLTTALDLPCGTGRLGDLFAQIADRVILADSSQLMLEVAREDLGDGKYEYLQTHAEQIALPNDGVDVVFCHRLLNHIPDPAVRARIVQELARVSRRYVLLSCYPPGLRTRLKLTLRNLLGMHDPAKQPATITEYIDLAQRNGLRVVRRHVLRRLPVTAELVLFEKTAP